MGIIILDTETTGHKKGEDRICQIAYITDISGDWVAHENYINPEQKITSNAMAIHHITNEMVSEAPSFKESEAFQFLDKVNTGEHTMVMQNAGFDLGVLRNVGYTWQGDVIDTLACAKHLLSTPRHALQYLRYELGLYKEEKLVADALGKTLSAHDALSDVIVTKLLLNHLLSLANNDLDNLRTLTNEPILLKVIPFGKYRGETFESAVKFDPKYFEWCLREMRNLKSDARSAIEFWLKEG